MQLDHVAIGVRDHREALSSLTGDLGALVLSGGTPPRAGFRAMQVRVGRGLQGMTVELLEPWGFEHNDFLVRFLDTGGEGVHHVTFKVDDVHAELERLRSIGVEPVAIDFSDPEWREMFVHPRDSHGTVVQIAQAGWKPPPMDEWLRRLPGGEMYFGSGGPWWDLGCVVNGSQPVNLARVVITTRDLDAGVAFYSGVLGGAVEYGPGWVDCVWDGGTIRLEPGGGDRPSVSRLEIEGWDGPELRIGGARFRPTPAV